MSGCVRTPASHMRSRPTYFFTYSERSCAKQQAKLTVRYEKAFSFLGEGGGMGGSASLYELSITGSAPGPQLGAPVTDNFVNAGAAGLNNVDQTCRAVQ